MVLLPAVEAMARSRSSSCKSRVTPTCTSWMVKLKRTAMATFARSMRDSSTFCRVKEDIVEKVEGY